MKGLIGKTKLIMENNFKIILIFFSLLPLLFCCKDNVIKNQYDAAQTIDPVRIVYFMAGDIETNEYGVLNINAFIPENMLSSVQNGMKVMIRVSGDDTNLFHGIISRINPDIDLKSKTALVEIKILDNNSNLKPGMIVMIGSGEKSKI
jgi:hypothetical protein